MKEYHDSDEEKNRNIFKNLLIFVAWLFESAAPLVATPYAKWTHYNIFCILSFFCLWMQSAYIQTYKIVERIVSSVLLLLLYFVFKSTFVHLWLFFTKIDIQSFFHCAMRKLTNHRIKMSICFNLRNRLLWLFSGDFCVVVFSHFFFYFDKVET